MNIKPLIDAVELLEAAKLATFDEKDRLEIGHAIYKVRCVLQKHGVFVGTPEASEPQEQPLKNCKTCKHWERLELSDAHGFGYCAAREKTKHFNYGTTCEFHDTAK